MMYSNNHQPLISSSYLSHTTLNGHTTILVLIGILIKEFLGCVFPCYFFFQISYCRQDKDKADESKCVCNFKSEPYRISGSSE